VRYRTESLPFCPPFQGGIAGLFGYDLCHRIERLPREPFGLSEVAQRAVEHCQIVQTADVDRMPFPKSANADLQRLSKQRLRCQTVAGAQVQQAQVGQDRAESRIVLAPLAAMGGDHLLVKTGCLIKVAFGLA